MKRLVFIALSLCSTPVMATWGLTAVTMPVGYQPPKKTARQHEELIDSLQRERRYEKYTHKEQGNQKRAHVPWRKDSIKGLYIGLIDALQDQNKTVHDYVKEKHKEEHTEAVKIIQKEFGLTDEKVKTVDEYIQAVKERDKLQPNTPIIFVKSNNENVNLNLNKKIAEMCQQYKLKFPLKIKHDESQKSSGASHRIKDNCETGGVKIIIGSDISGHDDYVSNAVILHEITHLKKYHVVERLAWASILSLTYKQVNKSSPFNKLLHLHEYQADQHNASKNVASTREMESFLKYTRRPFCTWSNSHPSDESRHIAVKDIRKQLEAEQRWYAGPKGYAKYGEPAFERMWDRQYENQRIKKFTSLLGAI